jgi:hypothetical protein
LLIVTSSHYSALDHPWAPSHILHFIPHSLRDASWVGIAIWISTFWPTTMLCSSFWGHWNLNLFKYPYKTNQARIKIQVSSQETLDLCSVQYWGELLGPHSLSLSSWPCAPDTRSLSWFNSGFAMGEEVCFGTAISWGQAVCVHLHLHHPYYANSLLGQYWTKSCSIAPYGLVTMALASILFCHKILPLHKLGS